MQQQCTNNQQLSRTSPRCAASDAIPQQSFERKPQTTSPNTRSDRQTDREVCFALRSDRVPGAPSPNELLQLVATTDAHVVCSVCQCCRPPSIALGASWSPSVLRTHNLCLSSRSRSDSPMPRHWRVDRGRHRWLFKLLELTRERSG